MKTKTVIIFLLGIFVLFGVSEAAINLYSTWSETQSYINEYRQKVNSELYKGLAGGLADLAQTADSAIESTISNGTTVITAKYNEYITEYDSIKHSAEEAGVNITICINYFEDQIKNVGPENVNGLTECVNEQIDPSVNYISQATIEIPDRYLSSVFQYEKSFLSCGLSNEDCLSNIVYGLVKLIARVEGNIASDIARSVYLFARYLSYINVCGEKHVSINEGKGRSLLDGFKSCVDSFIN